MRQSVPIKPHNTLADVPHKHLWLTEGPIPPTDILEFWWWG